MVPQGWSGDGSVLVGAAPPGEYFEHLLANGVAWDQYFYWSSWQIGSGEVGGNCGGGLFKLASDQSTGAGKPSGWITANYCIPDLGCPYDISEPVTGGLYKLPNVLIQCRRKPLPQATLCNPPSGYPKYILPEIGRAHV